MNKFDEVAAAMPYKDIVRYMNPARLEVAEDARWTLNDVKVAFLLLIVDFISVHHFLLNGVKYFQVQAEAFANGLFQTGMAVGDKFVVWMAEDDPAYVWRCRQRPGGGEGRGGVGALF